MSSLNLKYFDSIKKFEYLLLPKSITHAKTHDTPSEVRVNIIIFHTENDGLEAYSTVQSRIHKNST